MSSLNFSVFFLIALHCIIIYSILISNTIFNLSLLSSSSLGCTHCGFPVVKSLGETLENTFCGEITRLELRNLMTRPELFIRKTDFNTTVRMPHVSDIMHPHFRVSKKSPHLATDELLQQYMNEETYSDYFVNLSPYINDSGVCVPLHFSLLRAYILFRTLGLRHMTVVSHTNQVEGILTRKDLMGFAIGERLERLLTNPPRKLSRSVVLALRKNYGHKHMQKVNKDTNANGGDANKPPAATANTTNVTEVNAELAPQQQQPMQQQQQPPTTLHHPQGTSSSGSMAPAIFVPASTQLADDPSAGPINGSSAMMSAAALSSQQQPPQPQQVSQPAVAAHAQQQADPRSASVAPTTTDPTNPSAPPSKQTQQQQQQQPLLSRQQSEQSNNHVTTSPIEPATTISTNHLV